MKFTVPSMGSTTHRTVPLSGDAPPPSSPRIGSPGRSSASRVRIICSTSVSAIVTGSVGLLFVRIAPPVPERSPKRSARRRRTRSAASAASCSATPRSTCGKLSVTVLSQHNLPSVSDSPRSV